MAARRGRIVAEEEEQGLTHPAMAGFRRPVREWFLRTFEKPTRAQELAWPVIQAGETCLLQAPTGSGKTLAAFLAAIDGLMFDPVPGKPERCRVLYLSPLKALAVDIERNLRAPLVGVSRMAESLGYPFHAPEVALRTGDTPSKDRARFARSPADILITTPESLFLILTSHAREAVRSVRWVIVDEIHAMVSTKRGAHLSLSLERLEELTGRPLQRVGLSATVRPVEETSRFLAGYTGEYTTLSDLSAPDPDETEDEHASQMVTDMDLLVEPEEDALEAVRPRVPTPRPIRILDAGQTKQLDLTVEVAVEDMAKLGEIQELPSGPADQGNVAVSIWPAIFPMVLDLIRQHRSSLIFVNSRRLAERMAGALNELAGEDLVRAHHGSVAREQRLQIEDELKSGKLPAMVATSSLELGIDMGAIDLVIQVESPPSVASGIQRIGRAGHQIGVPSKGIIIPKYRGDLLSCAALTDRMRQGSVESLRYPRNPLDVLAQQIVAMVAMEEWRVEDLERLVRRSAPFCELSRSLLEGVLDMLAGRYPSDEFAELRPRITWDRIAGTLRTREGAKKIAIANSGTIPDRGMYGVFLAGDETSNRKTSGRVGELDEEMVHESREGDTFVLGATTWRIEEITHDRVLVSPAPGVPGKMPFWHGDNAGRPLEFGRAIGSLCRTLRSLPEDRALDLLMNRHDLTERAARNLLEYLQDQLEAAGAIPDDRTVVVERSMDELGDWRVCILSPLGSKIHAPWAMAIGAMIRERTELETDILWTDDGIVVRFPEADDPPPVELVIPEVEEAEDLVVRQLGFGGGVIRQAGFGSPVSSLFASRFREAAGRALLLPRRYPGQRAPLWEQRKRAHDLLQATARYGSFPIVLEAYRECLRDVFDMPALLEVLGQIQRRQLRIVTVDSRVPSPFASSLLFNYVANFIYEGDAPLAERRAQALTVDPVQLREILGEVELRELLDAGALSELEAQLQLLTPERRARHADGLHDLLLRLGDLAPEELAARCAPAGVESDGTPEPGWESWLEELVRARRAISLMIAGEERIVAAEDAGRYRDALGVPPPQGLPGAFLEFTEWPLEELAARFARTHGPFTATTLAERFGLGVAPVLVALQRLEASSRVVQGEFRPGGVGREWCDSKVLRSLRQRSLARLRHEVEPVDEAALGRLYVAWQGIGATRRGPEALLEVIEQLQGAALTASDLETRILTARLEEYYPADLDALTASGSVMWVGAEPLGERDGRVRLYLAEHAPLLHPDPQDPPQGPLHQLIRSHLAQRGASFFPHLVLACGQAPQAEVMNALWDLVWSGEVTNDTLQPLRAFLYPRHKSSAASSAPRRRPRAYRSHAIYPPESTGRWSLVSSLFWRDASVTERAAARGRQLLDRYGLLTREAVQAEGGTGGFSALYPVLRQMEEGGHARRGYFVAGRGATQFGLPGAVDRLRSLRETSGEMRSVVLAATDPANPYGAALPWPQPATDVPEQPSGEGDGAPAPARRATRSAGALVVLVDGALSAWMGRGDRQLLTFLEQLPDREPEDVADEVARALADQVRPGRRRVLTIKEVNGRPVVKTSMAAALQKAGFHYGPQGFAKRL